MEYIFSNVPHWHMLLNHVPSIGLVIVLGLYLTSFYLKSEDLNRTSLVLFMVLGLLAIPTYLSGVATKWAIVNNTDISLDLITAHQDAALSTFITLSATSFLAWLALWQRRRFSEPAKWCQGAVLIVAFISVLTMIETGSRGGEINHPEIRIAEAAAAETSSSEAITTYVFDTPWLWPTMEALHFIGMALLFGVVLVVSLRVLGIAKSIPFAALHRLLPLGVFGLVINIATGMGFLIVDSQRYTAIPAFYWKLALITIGGVVALYFTYFNHPWSLKAKDDATPTAKVVAAASILIWAGVLLLGRMLPYLEG
ncbi:MAG: hypothetical protein HOM55_09685 [Proteobacteria bacterium]|nr:hypothetical protein [Pseudomonadota bacterium]